MGWKKDGFVLGQTFYSLKGNEPVTLTGAGKQANAIRSNGSISGWGSAISGLMEHDAQRFKTYIAVVPPLLKILDESNICINDYGETSTGKTLTTKCAMSMYGDPEDLLFSGNTTQVGMERAATQFCDLPINLDDIQTVKKELLDSLVYMIANGVGKVRGAKLGGLQEVLTWRTVGLFTGEIPIITDSSFMGMDVRVIELYGGLKGSDKAAVLKFETGIKDNYGTFAPMLIEYLIKNGDKVVSIHAESQETIRATISDCFKDDKETSGIANVTVHRHAGGNL
jgi:putative DNA primase/helicase